jgi:hypothetical protein
MFGKDIGYLAVYKASSANKTLEEMLWRRDGEVDMYWHKGLVTVYDKDEFMVRVFMFLSRITRYFGL